MQFQTIMRRAGSSDRPQTDKSAYAVIHVHDNIAGIERRHFADEVTVAFPPLGMTNQPIAENVLFRNNDQFARVETGLQRKDARRDLVASKCLYSPQIIDKFDLFQTMFVQTCTRRSRVPSLHAASSTFLPAARSSAICLTTLSKTLVSFAVRSSTNVRPRCAPAWIVARPVTNGASNGVKSIRIPDATAPASTCAGVR